MNNSVKDPYGNPFDKKARNAKYVKILGEELYKNVLNNSFEVKNHNFNFIPDSLNIGSNEQVVDQNITFGNKVNKAQEMQKKQGKDYIDLGQTKNVKTANEQSIEQELPAHAKGPELQNTLAKKQEEQLSKELKVKQEMEEHEVIKEIVQEEPNPSVPLLGETIQNTFSLGRNQKDNNKSNAKNNNKETGLNQDILAQAKEIGSGFINFILEEKYKMESSFVARANQSMTKGPKFH